MKATGIIRRLDELGRVVIPKELRHRYGWAQGDPIEIYTTDEGIMLQKYSLGNPVPDNVRDGLRQLAENADKLELRLGMEKCLDMFDRAMSGDPQNE